MNGKKKFDLELWLLDHPVIEKLLIVALAFAIRLGFLAVVAYVVLKIYQAVCL